MAPTRQQTLRAALDWSDALPHRAERAAVPASGGVRRGFPLDAAEAVCADARHPPVEVLETLTRLVDKSLVIAADDDGEVRYSLLETVRQYALGHLTRSGEVEATRTRHLASIWRSRNAPPRYCAARSKTSGWCAWSTSGAICARRLSWAGECGVADIGARLATALVPFWEAHGPSRRGGAG